MNENDKKHHNLRYWREVLGLKQKDIATLLGCTRATYNKKENGSIEFRCSEMLLIQESFNKLLSKNNQIELTLDNIFCPKSCVK